MNSRWDYAANAVLSPPPARAARGEGSRCRARISGGTGRCWRRPASERGVDRVAMCDQALLRHETFLERRVDVVEMDVGDESIHCRIDAAGLGSEHVSAAGKEIRKRIEIGDATGVGVSRFVASDALKVVALDIEF